MTQDIRIAESIADRLSYSQLQQLAAELDAPAGVLRAVVDQRIAQIEEASLKQCASCGTQAHGLREGHYQLQFGVPGLRKRASFCGLDCLQSFTTDLRRIKDKRHSHDQRHHSQD